jgi:hypothetical protein
MLVVERVVVVFFDEVSVNVHMMGGTGVTVDGMLVAAAQPLFVPTGKELVGVLVCLVNGPMREGDGGNEHHRQTNCESKHSVLHAILSSLKSHMGFLHRRGKILQKRETKSKIILLVTERCSRIPL